MKKAGLHASVRGVPGKSRLPLDAGRCRKSSKSRLSSTRISRSRLSTARRSTKRGKKRSMWITQSRTRACLTSVYQVLQILLCPRADHVQCLRVLVQQRPESPPRHPARFSCPNPQPRECSAGRTISRGRRCVRSGCIRHPRPPRRYLPFVGSRDLMSPYSSCIVQEPDALSRYATLIHHQRTRSWCT